MAELIIVFREVLEASLIIGILYTFFDNTKNNDAKKQLWSGVFFALIASFIGFYSSSLSKTNLLNIQIPILLFRI